MELWLTLPRGLSKIVREYYGYVDTLFYDIKNLTDCRLSQGQYLTDDEKKPCLREMRAKLNLSVLEASVVLMRLLNCTLDELCKMNNAYKGDDYGEWFFGEYYASARDTNWVQRRSVAETVMVYWPKEQRNFFVTTFCTSVSDLGRCKWGILQEEFKELEKHLFEQHIGEMLALDKKEAIVMAEFRQVHKWGWFTGPCGIIDISTLMKLIEHIGVTPSAITYDHSRCKPYAAKCQHIQSKFYCWASFLQQEIIECKDQAIKRRFCSWIGYSVDDNEVIGKKTLEKAIELSGMLMKSCPIRTTAPPKKRGQRRREGRTWRNAARR